MDANEYGKLPPALRLGLWIKCTVLALLFKLYPHLPDKVIIFISRRLLQLDRLPMSQNVLEKGMLTVKQALRDMGPSSRKKIIRNFFFNECVKGDAVRARVEKALGVDMPTQIVISPTMQCPLRCGGCYSAQYAKDSGLEFEVVDRLITEAKSLGIYFFVLSGGEPLVYPRIYDLLEKHHDACFQMYTSSVTLDKSNVRRLAELGTVVPCISVEGFETETDRRRGKGHFMKVLTAFDNLREAKVPFGFSATATRENNELVVSDNFVDFYGKQGALIGWYFQYMPIGRSPNFDLVPTPRQRIYRFYRMIELRRKFGLFIADFWNDGWLTGGCMAGGRRYLHVNHTGDIEPCVFCQVAIENIHSATLFDTLKSSTLFKAIRKRQPYHENFLRPCMIIDNPVVLKEIMEEVRPRETCGAGAARLVADLKDEVQNYAAQYGALADAAWAKLFGNGNVPTLEEAHRVAMEELAEFETYIT